MSNRPISDLPEGTVTFLFTDIQGSTQLLRTLGDKYIFLLAEHNRILHECFARWNGREVGTEGDSFFVSFLRSADAVSAVVEAQRALVAHDWPDGAEVCVRMGLHTGEPWNVEEGYAGIDVHRAARIGDVGHGGQVLLSETTAALVRGNLPDGVQLLDLGYHQLKNMQFPEHFQQLVIEGLPAEFPPLRSLRAIESTVPIEPKPARLPAFLAESEPEPERPIFVGRESELARLDDYLKAVLASQGQVAFLAGDAGSGKSSLVSAFATRAGHREPNLLVGRGICNAFSGRGDPYLPFRKVLSALTGDLEAEWAAGTVTSEQARAMWTAMPVAIEALMDHGPDLLDTIMPAAPLRRRLESAYPAGHPLLKRLGVKLAEDQPAGQTERAQIFEQVTATLRRLAEQRPVIIILDDLQWADRGSLDLLFHLARGLAGARILLLIVYRPDEVTTEADHPLRPLIDELRRGHGDVWLDLNQAPGRAFVDELIDSEANHLDDKFRERLVKRTAGHPLFTVELLRDMQERGDLVQDVVGAWTLGPTLDWDALPVRVEGTIEARIGRLDEELQDILSVAAVEGEVFTVQVVARVQEVQERQLLRTLSRELVKRHRLIQEDQTERYGGQLISLYRFTHHLFQRYLYNDLSETERRLLHGEVGEILETLYEDKTDEVIVQLARHFDEAGESEKAASYLLAAGDQARSLYASEEAIEHYQRALEHLQNLGDQTRLARTWMRLGLTYHNAFDYQRSRQAYDQGFAIWRTNSGMLQDLQAETTLRVWMPRPSELDPSRSADLDSSSWERQLFGGLVEMSDEMVVVPDIAHSWEISNGGRTYIFHLRQDAKWSDGHPLTARDFVRAWRRQLAPETSDSVARRLFDIKGAQAFHHGELTDEKQLSLQVPDDFTLVVELEQPTSYFLHLLTDQCAFPIPSHVVNKFGDQWSDPQYIVSNGPFMIANWSWEKGVSLARNPYYHGVFHGNISQIEASLQGSQDDWRVAMEQYSHGEVDLLETMWFPGNVMKLLQRRYGEYFITIPEPTSIHIAFDLERPPFDDVRVRQALALAFDQVDFVRALQIDNVVPAQGGFVPPGVPGYSPDIGLPFDPAVARRLMSGAGYPEGKGFPPQKLFWMDLPSSKERAEYLCQVWQEQLGVDIQPVYVPPRDLVAMLLRREPPAIFSIGWIADFPDPDNFLRVGLGSAHQNKHQFRDKVELARTLTDQDERLDLYREADRLLTEEANLIPLFYQLAPYFISPRVRKFSKKLLWRDIIIDPD